MKHLILTLSLSSACALLGSVASGQCTLVQEFRAGSSGGSPDELSCCFGDTLYFGAPFGYSHLKELWKWNAANGATQITSIFPGGAFSPKDITPCWTGTEELIVFKGRDPIAGEELFRTNGTPGGTTLVRDIRPGTASSAIQDPTPCAGQVFFKANDGTAGNELWVTDGTLAGTNLVLDILPGSGHGITALDKLVCHKGILYFGANDGVNGQELWRSDGTAPGTYMVIDLVAGTGSSGAVPQISWNGELYFIATNGSTGGEIFKTDGTAGGTVLVKDINPGPLTSSATAFTPCNGTLFFLANEPVAGTELWKTDGTGPGTTLVRDITPGATGTGFGEMGCANDDTLLFAARDSFTVGIELWKSDGTEPGTCLLMDIDPNPRSSSQPGNFVSAGAGAYFVARNAASGTELWFSDGTVPGTAMVCDLSPGAGSGIPQQLTLCCGELFFQANTPATGRELYSAAIPTGVRATTQDLGGASGPGFSELAGSNPIAGTMMTLRGLQGRAGTFGLLSLGLLSPPAGPLAIGGALTDGGADWTQLQLLNAVILMPVHATSYTRSILIPGMVPPGTKYNLQDWWIDLTPAPGEPPIEVSNGLRITTGGS